MTVADRTPTEREPRTAPATMNGRSLLSEWLQLRYDHPPNTEVVRRLILAIEDEAHELGLVDAFDDVRKIDAAEARLERGLDRERLGAALIEEGLLTVTPPNSMEWGDAVPDRAAEAAYNEQVVQRIAARLSVHPDREDAPEGGGGES